MLILDPRRWFSAAPLPQQDRLEPQFSADVGDSGVSRPEQWLRDALGGRPTASGRTVSPSSAMRISAVFAAVNVRGGTLASLPCFLYRRIGSDNRKLDTEHPLFRILHSRPNRWQTAMDFVQMMQMHEDLRGNAFARIYRDGRGQVTALIPLHPDRVQMLVSEDDEQEIFYEYSPARGPVIRLPQREIMHLRALSEDGYMGISRIAMARERLGIAVASEEYAGKFFANDARPSIVLQHPKRIGKDNAERLRTQWNEAYAGAHNSHKTAVLEEGMQAKELGMTNVDAQFIELMQFTIKDIARFFDTPGFLIGDDTKVATYGSAEQSVSMFEKFTMVEIARHWEQSILRDLLREDEQETHFAEFQMQALTRGDFKTRSEGYGSGIQNGWLTRNEVRRYENLPPLEGLDEPLSPMNMQPGGGKAAPTPAPKPGNIVPVKDGDEEDE